MQLSPTTLGVFLNWDIFETEQINRILLGLNSMCENIHVTFNSRGLVVLFGMIRLRSTFLHVGHVQYSNIFCLCKIINTKTAALFESAHVVAFFLWLDILRLSSLQTLSS